MPYQHRTLERILEKASLRFKVLLLTGMRQVGKSTLLLQLAGKRTSVTLDDFRPLETARRMRDVFFQQYRPPILIDEIQRAPELCLEIKALVDREQAPGLVWLTGSKRFSLMRSISESLAGRMADFELLPFSLYERQGLAFEQKPWLPSGSLERGALESCSAEETWRIIWQGSWPEVIGMDADERDWFYNGLMHSYLERDVHLCAGVAKLEDFRRFLGVLVSRIGQEFQIGKAASETGIALQTARDWLSIAEASGIIYLLPPFSENIGKILIKKPKLYFADTGLAAWLADMTSPAALQSSYLNGAFFENFVIMELRKSWVHNGRRASFFFYRDSAFNEVDLLIKEGAEYFPVEIKMSEHPDASMAKAFRLIRGGSFTRGPGAVICLAKSPCFLTPDVTAHSIWDI